MAAAVNLICVDNGAGLSRDMALLAGEIERAGLAVRLLSPWDAGPFPAARLNLFLEILNPRMLELAPLNALIPNPEWWAMRMTSFLSRLEVLAKTLDALKLFQPLAARVHYTGFSGQDRLRPHIPRRREFLHLAGHSKTKGTAEVLQAWNRHPDWPTLHLVTRRPLPAAPGPNVRLWSGYVSDELLLELQNRCLFHVCPSEYEGFGHHLHEARSVGAVILTTDAPPMNELTPPGAGILIPPAGYRPRRLARAAVVTAEAVAEAVEQALSASSAEIRRWQAASRHFWLYSRRQFHQAFQSWLKGVMV